MQLLKMCYLCEEIYCNACEKSICSRHSVWTFCDHRVCLKCEKSQTKICNCKRRICPRCLVCTFCELKGPKIDELGIINEGGNDEGGNDQEDEDKENKEAII